MRQSAEVHTARCELVKAYVTAGVGIEQREHSMHKWVVIFVQEHEKVVKRDLVFTLFANHDTAFAHNNFR